MEVRAAHVARQPLEPDNIRSRLGGIAEQYRLLVRPRGIPHPLDLGGWSEIHRRAVDVRDSGRAQCECEKNRAGDASDGLHVDVLVDGSAARPAYTSAANAPSVHSCITCEHRL